MNTSTASTTTHASVPGTGTSTADPEFDLDVSIVSSGLIAPGFSSEDCTSDGCGDTSGPNC